MSPPYHHSPSPASYCPRAASCNAGEQQAARTCATTPCGTAGHLSWGTSASANQQLSHSLVACFSHDPKSAR
eukprot:5538623-Pleurochrysis_carterae.AAC.1